MPGGPEDLEDRGACFRVDAEALRRINPLTGTCPPLKGPEELDLLSRMHRRFPCLGASGSEGWGIELFAPFHMSGHSRLFRTGESLRRAGFRRDGAGRFVGENEAWVRLYEAKLFHQLDHRWSTFAGTPPARRKGIKPRVAPFPEKARNDPASLVEPRYWVPETQVETAAARRGWTRRWFLAVRSVTNVATNRRTVVSAVLPWCGVGNSATLIASPRSAREMLLLAACLSSLAFDRIARMKLPGPNLNFFIFRQLPLPGPEVYARPFQGRTLGAWLFDRAFPLVYRARDLDAFAADCGVTAPPRPLDPEGAEGLRAELDGAFFRLFGYDRDEVAAALETFPILKRREMARWGRYRTAERVLEAFEKIVTGAIFP